MYPAAVIFDFDGVIVDTEPLHYQAFQKILSPRNLGYSWEDYLAVYMGFDDRDAFREAFAQRGVALSEGELEQLIAHKAVIFQEVIASGVAPYPASQHSSINCTNRERHLQSVAGRYGVIFCRS